MASFLRSARAATAPGWTVEEHTHCLRRTRSSSCSSSLARTKWPSRRRLGFFAIAGKRHRARQTLGKSTLRNIIDVSSGDILQQIQSMPVWQLSPDVKPYTRWLYKSLLVTFKRDPAYFLNKLMLCKQVELTSKHFRVTTLDDIPILLYYNKTGQRIYNNEFVKGSGRNDEQSFRICVSDARLGSNESGRLQISLKLLLLSTTIFNVL